MCCYCSDEKAVLIMLFIFVLMFIVSMLSGFQAHSKHCFHIMGGKKLQVIW